jgi:hypothetical protein
MSVQGQASAEYAGLLAVAAVLGATLALIAGPPLASAVSSALAGILTGSPGLTAPTAADIADVASALRPGGEAVTPDAALLALGRRHESSEAAEVAGTVLLAAARNAAPWVGARHAYRAWTRLDDGPYAAATTADGDRDVEEPTGPPQVAWVTVRDQRRALAAAFAHHTSWGAVALDAVGIIPVAGMARAARDGVTRAARSGARLERLPSRLVPRAIDAERTGSQAIDLFNIDDDAIPAGVRSGDVVVAWPVQRTFWRDGKPDPAPRIDVGFGTYPLTAQHYWHRVFLRPGAGGLAVIAEGIGA